MYHHVPTVAQNRKKKFVFVLQHPTFDVEILFFLPSDISSAALYLIEILITAATRHEAPNKKSSQHILQHFFLFLNFHRADSPE